MTSDPVDPPHAPSTLTDPFTNVFGRCSARVRACCQDRRSNRDKCLLIGKPTRGFEPWTPSLRVMAITPTNPCTGSFHDVPGGLEPAVNPLLHDIGRTARRTGRPSAAPDRFVKDCAPAIDATVMKPGRPTTCNESSWAGSTLCWRGVGCAATSPSPPRPSACHAGGGGFESRRPASQSACNRHCVLSAQTQLLISRPKRGPRSGRRTC